MPAPLAWDVAPASWSLDQGPALTIAAPARSDLFNDPAGGEPMTAAPRLLGPVEGDFLLSARVRCTFAANAFVVADDAVFLRVARLGPACALHARLEGEAWRFVRHFALDTPDAVRAGFLVQSPTGDGATARFDEIDFVAERPADLRSGV